MKGLRTKLGLGLAALAVTGVAFGATPSKAAAGTGVVVGHGTISPGLTLVPTFQKGSFTGTLAAVGTQGSGSYHCNFTFSSTIKETSAKGQGTARGTCSGPGTATATVNYKRTVSNVSLSGSSTGSLSGPVKGDCSFEPTSNPVKSYQLQCVLAIV
jgi:hypothetical protein